MAAKRRVPKNRRNVLEQANPVDVAALILAEEEIRRRIAEYRSTPKPPRRRYTNRIDKALADARAQIARDSARATDTTSDWSGRVKIRR